MICPHCSRTIPEERVYMMSRRTPTDEPLGPWAMAVLRFAMFAGLFIALVFLAPMVTPS